MSSKSGGSTRSSQKQGDMKKEQRPTSNKSSGANVSAQKSESDRTAKHLATGASSAPPLSNGASLLVQGSTRQVREEGKEVGSRHEDAARPPISQKEVETLQEELQTKNQQVKQYQRQVDSCKAELDRCRADLKRLQEQGDEGVEHLRKEKEDLEAAIKVVYQDADTQLNERDLKWQELLDKTKEESKHLQRQSRETSKKYYVQKYLTWCQILFSDNLDGKEPRAGTGEEEKALLEVIREYQERTREKLRAMEERYQHDLTAQEEGFNKKLSAMEERYQHDLTAQEEGFNKRLRAMELGHQHELTAQKEGSNKKLATEKRPHHPVTGNGDGQSAVEERVKEVEAMYQHREEELVKRQEAVMKEKEQIYSTQLERVRKYYKQKYEGKVQQRGVGNRPESGSSGTPEEVMRPVGTEEARGHKGEKVDDRGDYRRSVKRLQREHKELLREKMEAHLVELDKAKSSYREKYEALVASSSMSASQMSRSSMKEASSEGGGAEALEQRVADLSKQLQSKDAEVAKITEEYKKQEEQLMAHVQNQSKIIVELKSSKASSEDVIKQLMEQLDVVRREKSQLEREVQGARARGAQALQREVERLKEENSSQANALQAMSREKANVEGELELIRAQAQTFKEDFLQERKDREAAHAMIGKMEAGKGQVEQLRRQVEEYKEELEKCRSELERMKLEHQVPMPSPGDAARRDPQSRINIHQSLSTGATTTAPPRNGRAADRPPPPSHHLHGGDGVRSHSRQRNSSLGSVKQFGLGPSAQQGGGASQYHHQPLHYQKQPPGGHPMIMAPLLPLRADSSHLRAPSGQERGPQQFSVSGGCGSEVDLLAHIDTEIHRQVASVANLSQQLDENAPLDPNLTCPVCRGRFRKGEIQSYKRHVAACQTVTSTS